MAASISCRSQTTECNLGGRAHPCEEDRGNDNRRQKMPGHQYSWLHHEQLIPDGQEGARRFQPERLVVTTTSTTTTAMSVRRRRRQLVRIMVPCFCVAVDSASS